MLLSQGESNIFVVDYKTITINKSAPLMNSYFHKLKVEEQDGIINSNGNTWSRCCAKFARTVTSKYSSIGIVGIGIPIVPSNMMTRDMRQISSQFTVVDTQIL